MTSFRIAFAYLVATSSILVPSLASAQHAVVQRSGVERTGSEHAPRRRYSPALIVVGSVVSGLGVAALAAGAAFYASQPTLVDCACDGPCYCAENEKTAGVATMVAGGGVALIGIPLIVVGALKVPAERDAATAVPDVAVGARGGALRWRF
jgi:hypothetical protein